MKHMLIDYCLQRTAVELSTFFIVEVFECLVSFHQLLRDQNQH